jgi:acyl-coenzyme A thioesterase PaaI-like protein
MTAPSSERAGDQLADDSVLPELALTIVAVGDELHGEFPVLETMCTPGTDVVRPSVAATQADAVLGLHAIRALAPRLPVTLDLDVHLFPEAAGLDRMLGVSRLVRAGRNVIVTDMEFRSPAGRVVGYGSGAFMAIPEPGFRSPDLDEVLGRFGTPRGTLSVPIAERIGCVRTGPGTAVLPSTSVVHNGAAAINGGMLAVVAEEAALAADPGAARLESIHLRFVRGVRVGPAVATADAHGGMARVEVRDASTGGIAAVATTRAVPA